MLYLKSAVFLSKCANRSCWTRCSGAAAALCSRLKDDGSCFLFMNAQELLDAVEQCGGRFLLTADHGNAEDMVQVGFVVCR